MWSEQRLDSEHVVSGSPNYNNTSAAALLSYDIAHSIPWDWRVSLYTWTKGIAAGVYLVGSLLVLFGFLASNSEMWLWATPIVSGLFLAITGGLLIWDLEHPERFYLIFTRPQWRSWLVKGAFIIAGYSLVLALHFVASWLGSTSLQRWLMIPGIPLSVGTAIYTAYLFAQAKARDMWQNPLLPPHLFVQALLLGSAILLQLRVTTGIYQPASLDVLDITVPLLWLLAVSSLISSASDLGRSIINARDSSRAFGGMGDGARPLQERLLDRSDIVGPGRIDFLARHCRHCRHFHWCGRCSDGFDRTHALRERLRASWSISAIGLNTMSLRSMRN